MSISRELRRQVAERAGHRCEYCCCPDSHSVADYSVEHILPTWSCQGCNQYKFTAVSGTDTLTARKIRLFHPRRLHWNRHFEWSEDLLRLFGKTPTGRATIQRLKLNRLGVVNLRRALLATNEHPP